MQEISNTNERGISIYKILIFFLPFFYCFEYTSYGQSISGTKYIIMLAGTGFMLISSKVLIIIDKKLIGLFVAAYLIIPITQTIIYGNLSIFVYAIVMCLFIYTTLEMGRFLSDTDSINQFLVWLACITTTIIFVCYLLNSSNLFNVNAIMSNFNADITRERSAFGFMHVNSLGGECFAAIVAWLSIKTDGKWKNAARIVALVFVILILLNTGSRASIYASIAYVIVRAMQTVYYRSQDAFKIILRVILIVCAIAAMLLIWNMWTTDFEALDEWFSGRPSGWIYSLSKAVNDGKILLGYGLLNPTNLFAQSFADGMIVDNWYVYMIISIGIVGFVINVIAIIYIIRTVLRKIRNIGNDPMLLSVFALIIGNLLHASAEKAFITPADPISFLMMIMIGYALSREEPEYENSIS